MKTITAPNGKHSFTNDDVAEYALNLMLAADKRWSEYTKGGEDD